LKKCPQIDRRMSDMQTHTNTHKYIPHEYVVGNQHTLVFQPLTGLQPRLLIETMRRDENQWDHTGETQKIRKRKQESENGREKGEERVHSDHDPAVSCLKIKGGRPTRRFLIISAHIGATTEGGIHPIDVGMHTHIHICKPTYKHAHIPRALSNRPSLLPLSRCWS
jgi:hypothetical protein